MEMEYEPRFSYALLKEREKLAYQKGYRAGMKKQQKLKSAQQEKLNTVTIQTIHDFVDKEWQAGEYGYPESYEVGGMIADFIRQVLMTEVEEKEDTDEESY